MSNPFELDDDELRWKIWDCSFYGKIPSINVDSAASLVLPMDVVLHQMEWAFPDLSEDGWVLDLCIDEVLWESIPLVIQSSGFYSFKTNGKGVYLPKGTMISTHIRFLGDEEEGDFSPHRYTDARYSVFLSGLTVVASEISPLSETFPKDESILKWNWFNDWQAEHS